MKNMMLPAKSCSILLCALLLFAAGCKDKNAPETFNGNVAAPTWTAPQASDMTSSMTAVVKVDLKVQYPDQAADWQRSDNDRLAAFSGETCIGVGSWIEEAGVYNLYIAAPTANANANAVTLRYYSAHYKNLFEASDAFVFHKDDRLGTPDNHLVPTFVVVK